jgi:hypothetical protein
MVLKYKASVANTGACTFNPNGLGAKSIVGFAHSALQGGEIVINSDVWLQYNSSIGGGSWILIDSSGGALQVAQASKSQHAVPLAQAQTMFSSPIGTATNLKMTVSTASAAATVTADELIVGTALGGQTYRIGSYSKSINLATTGAGGMDTGTAPVNGWLAIYAGLNETTGATTVFAQSVGNTVAPAVYGGANAPAGITATALLTVVPTNASGQFKVCLVQGKRVKIQLATAYTGNASVSNNPISIAGIVPANAIEITQGELTLQNSAQSSMSLTVGADSNYLGQQNVTNLVAAGASLTLNYGGTPIITPQQVMFTSSSSAGTPTYYFYISGYLLP